MALRTILVMLLVAAPMSVASLGAQDALDKVKDLYEAAAYEDALSVLTSLPEASVTPESEQYRAFCLIALGREAQAEAAIEGLLKRDPLYVPNPSETSPRVLQEFDETRLRILPDLTNQMYADAKAALERKERQAAIDGFERVIQVIDAMSAASDHLKDMRLLAAGFLDLSKAIPEAPKPAPTPTEATNGNVTPAPPAAAPVVSSTRPVVIKQEMPPWNVVDDFARRREFTGVLRVRIGADGRVQTAEFVKRVHPSYDAALLRAAADWRYEPARENGVAVPSELLIEIRLSPPPE